MTTAAPPLQQSFAPQFGLLSWLATADHKRLGIMMIAYAAFFAVAGGALAGGMRAQLTVPQAGYMAAETYNQLVGMHASAMIFGVVIPAFAGFALYLLPLQLGLRQVAWPRLAALSVWLLVPAGALALASFRFGSTGAGWTAYPPLSSRLYSNHAGMDLWIVAVLLFTAAALLHSLCIIGTFVMRERGRHATLFAWAVVTTAWLQVIAAPVFLAAMGMLLADRLLGTTFFEPGMGGDPLLYQHLFWFYSHPVVYIMILPGFGIVSQVIPAFARHRLVGERAMVASTLAIGLLGLVVWGHHMSAAGLPSWAKTLFGAMTMAIAIPTATKVFSWIATIRLGRPRLAVPMLYACGFVALFTFGGLTGVVLSIIPLDVQLHDTWFVVGHLHYVLFGGSVMTMLAGLYYWFPKMSGAFLPERTGRVIFWLMFGGMNIAFLPMHWLGLKGLARRVYTFHPELTPTQELITIGYLLMAVGALWLALDVARSLARRQGAIADDCWDAAAFDGGLEWRTASPPPAQNFAGQVPA